LLKKPLTAYSDLAENNPFMFYRGRKPVPDAIFISYRRDDAEGEAGRLFDDLVRAFGDDAVFMDVAGIKPGVDFRKAIEDSVTSCGVFLAVVGPTWATIAGPDGKRRLEDPNDFVALEISSALKREVPVIPVLVHDARMPPADLLPEALKSFSYRNSVELSHTRWNSDVALLIEALKAYVTPSPSRPPDSVAPVHANVPVQLPAPHHPSGTAAPEPARSKTPVWAGIGAAAVLAIAAGIFFAMHSASKPQPNPTPAPAPAVPAQAAPAPAVEDNSTRVRAASRPNANPNPVPAVAPAAAPAAAPPASGAEFVGTWRRTGGGDSDALGMLVISASRSGLTVHAYGRCQAPSCDWGAQPGVISGGSVIATFSPSPNGSDTSRTAMVTAHPVPGGLDVLIHNTFQNPAGTRANNSHRFFANAQ
jgi:hypothetical protein